MSILCIETDKLANKFRWILR